MSDTENTTTKALDTSTIDAAIAAAQARKAAKKAAGNTDGTEVVKGAKPPKAEKAEKPVKDKTAADAERAAKQAEILKEREARKAAKVSDRSAKLAEKLAARGPAHMSKVQRAAEKLPELTEVAQGVFNDATTNLTGPQLAALASHLAHFNRVRATERALGTKIEAGVKVTIIGGDPRFVGKTGTVAKAQRIRCYVDVPGVNKQVYLFTSDVEALVEAATEATGTEGLKRNSVKL